MKGWLSNYLHYIYHKEPVSGYSSYLQAFILFRGNTLQKLISVNDNITMNRKWKIKMYKNDH